MYSSRLQRRQHSQQQQRAQHTRAHGVSYLDRTTTPLREPKRHHKQIQCETQDDHMLTVSRALRVPRNLQLTGLLTKNERDDIEAVQILARDLHEIKQKEE